MRQIPSRPGLPVRVPLKASGELIWPAACRGCASRSRPGRAEGLVGHSEGQAIEARPSDALRARAARTVLLIGAALFGVGLIGVVAANLDVDEIEPLARSLLVALVLSFEPALILAWAADSLVYAYATRRSGRWCSASARSSAGMSGSSTSGRVAAAVVLGLVDPQDRFRNAYVDLRLRGMPTHSERDGRADIALRRKRRWDLTRLGDARASRRAGRSGLRPGRRRRALRHRLLLRVGRRGQAPRARVVRRGAIARVEIDGASRSAFVDLEPR